MAEQKDSVIQRAGNVANKLHGTAQVVRGMVTADFLAVVSGTAKLVSPQVIVAIICVLLLIILLPVIIISSLPQVLFGWGSINDAELLQRYEHSQYLQSCYTSVGGDEEYTLWLIAIDAVRHKQDVTDISESSVNELAAMVRSTDADGNVTQKTPDTLMDELGFSDDQKNWAQLMFNTVKTGQETGDVSLPIAVGGTNNGIPSEAYSDEKFAKLINEAEKYLGYPYVFGGSSPSTSFDCSGFVCWVYTQSGVHNLPRTTAQGIYNQCTRVSESEAKPGDLIFFQGTYNAGETVTHVGIYVGNNRMLHCGSPIQYTSIDTSYWRSHLYAYGRL